MLERDQHFYNLPFAEAKYWGIELEGLSAALSTSAAPISSQTSSIPVSTPNNLSPIPSSSVSYTPSLPESPNITKFPIASAIANEDGMDISFAPPDMLPVPSTYPFDDIYYTDFDFQSSLTSSLTPQPLDWPSTTHWFAQYVEDESAKCTPATLGWIPGTELLDLYTFNVPKHEEPFFELHSPWSPTSQTPHIVYLDQPKTAVKGSYPCQYPGTCNSKLNTFSRPADLTRHYENVHADANMNGTDNFPCDYPKCKRSKKPFHRKDHYRDHLKYFHKEDLGYGGKSKNKWTRKEEQRRWLAERNVSPEHWRCARCLAKHHITQVGWDCPTCKISCEEERIEARMRLTREIASLDPDESVGSHQESSDIPNTDTLPAPMPPRDVKSRNILKILASKIL